MFKKKNRQSEDKPLLLNGYVLETYNGEKSSNKRRFEKNEKRANLLYNHPDNERENIEGVAQKTINSPKYFEPDFKTLENKNSRVKENFMRNLKYERSIKELQSNAKALYNKQINNIMRESADFFINNGYNYVGTHLVKFSGGVDAEKYLRMSLNDQYLDTPFARQNKIYKSVNEVSPFLREHVKAKIVQQLGAEFVYKIGGILFDNDISVSKKIAESKEVKEFILKNRNVLLNYGFIKKDSIAFKEKNLHNAYGLADIIDMYLTPEGEITFYLIDVYDFNKYDTRPQVEAGRRNQEKGRILPYFSITSVKIEKERAQRYLNGN